MDTILFGKYQLIRILGKGRCGTVYLALHLELEEYRAIKQVPKNCVEYQQFRREALLLKRLRHSGIPIVYDLQEDEQFSYLIEEFISGESFYEIIQKKGPMSPIMVIRYGIQLCGLVDYLHSAEELPILYLDLQPRNLILCHEQVKLLDFEQAGSQREVNQRKERYGTPGFCAPEQQKEEELGVYTDIYQIGAVLAYLLGGREGQKDILMRTDDLGKIIRRCLHQETAKRYASVSEVQQELRMVYEKTSVSENQQTSLILYVAGSRPGIGVTHLALGFSTYLNQWGYSCLYEEYNVSGDIRALAEWQGREMDAYGICRSFGLPMKPRYGEAVRLPEYPYPIVIRDYGNNWSAAAEDMKAAGETMTATGTTQQMMLLVTGGKWWHQERALEIEAQLMASLESPIVVIFNQLLPGICGRRWKEEQRQGRIVCYQAPEFPDPFQLNVQAKSFYELLGKQVLKLSGRSRRRIWDSFVRNWEKRILQKKNIRN